MSKVFIFAILCIILGSAQATAHAATVLEVKTLLEKLPEPDHERFDFNEYSLKTKIVTIRFDKYTETLKNLQSEFWAQTWMSPEANYQTYEQAAFENMGSISTYKMIGDSVEKHFVDLFVSKAPANASLHEEIIRALPSDGNFAIGYMEGMAETFGDHFYVFCFTHPFVVNNGVPAADYFYYDLLVVTIKHTHH